MNHVRITPTAEQADRLMKARCRLMTREPWYGHVAMSMTWIPSEMSWLPEEARTMGVRIVNGGEVQCVYYPPFVERMTIKETFAVIQHEIEHIVRVHCVRVGQRERVAWNIAADMCVNGRRDKPRIGYHESKTNEIIVPMKGNICWIPNDWDESGTTEQFYENLTKRQKGNATCPKCGKSTTKGSNPGQKGKGQKGKGKEEGDGDDEGDGQKGNKQGQKGKGGKGQGKEKGEQGDGDGGGEGQDGQQGQSGGAGCCSQCGQGDEDYNYGGYSGKMVDDHSTWNDSDVSEDEARQIVKDIVDEATTKCQGHFPGHLEQAIKELGKPVVKWRDVLRRYIGKHVGNSRLTHSRRNRRHDWFGMPGISHHAAATVNVIVDTSGSIGNKELEQFFAEIDAISARAKVHVLQWDHAFQGFQVYRRNDWKKFKIHGRGGTDMAQPVMWLMKERRIADLQIMLTDGHCNYAEKQEFPMLTVITTPEGTTDGPKWGMIIRMRVTG